MNSTPNLEKLRNIIAQMSSMRDSLQYESKEIMKIKESLIEAFNGDIQPETINACMNLMDKFSQGISEYGDAFESISKMFEQMYENYSIPSEYPPFFRDFES